MRRIFAVLLMLAGAGGLFTVFLLLPYMARSYDWKWLGQHSAQAQWEYTQDYIRQFGWRHDDAGEVGVCGGEEWAEWIMARLPIEHDPRECGSGHKVSALKNITNFSPVLDDSAPWKPWKEELPLWLSWWEQHQHQTQAEWIVDGFAAMGVTIHNPPVKEDWPALLKVLGQVNPKFVKGAQEAGRVQPGHLYHNAYRCLRDSSFDPVKFALEEPLTPEVKAGLLYYSKRQISAGNTWGRQPGRLFGAGDPDAIESYIHSYLEPEFRMGWGSAAVVMFLAGVWLWWKPIKWKPWNPAPLRAD